MLRWHRLVACYALILWLVVAASASGEPLRATHRSEDARLQKRVTISEQRIYIGGLIERLTAQSGVELTAGAKGDGSGDCQVSVFVSQVPLADVMDALWSLMSYQGAEWHWSRVGSPGRYRYDLTCPGGVESAAHRMQAQIQTDFETHASSMLEALRLPPERLRSLAGRDIGIDMLLADDRTGLGPRQRGGLAAFAGLLTQEQQLRVLRGAESVRLPVAQLPAPVQEWTRSIWAKSKASRTYRDGRQEAVPPPAWVEFRASRPGAAVTPALFIQLENLGGYGYMGGSPFEGAFQGRLQDRWMQRGDTGPSARDDADVRRPQGQSLVSPRARIVEERLRQLAAHMPVNVMARLPRSASLQRDPGEPFGMKVAVFLDRLKQADLSLRWKWRKDVLLVSDPGWFLPGGDDLLVPWVTVKRLRKSADRDGGLLPLDELTATAAELSEPQLDRLADEFPVMRFVASWQGVFALAGKSPEARQALTSREGVAAAELLPLLRSQRAAKGIPEFLKKLEDGTAARIRLGVVRSSGFSSVQEFRVEILDANGVRIGGGASTDRGRVTQ